MADGEFNKPFNVTKSTIRCPFHDGEDLKFELGWVTGTSGPVLHISAPEVVAHLNQEHKGQF